MNNPLALPKSPEHTRTLWWGWVAPPTWWLTQFEIRYAAVPAACHLGHRWLVFLIGLLALLGAFSLVVQVLRLGRERAEEPLLQFIHRGALVIAVFFSVLVFVQLLPDLFLGPCDL